MAPVKVIHSSITLRINKEAEGSAGNYWPGKTRSKGRGLTSPLCAMHVADRWKKFNSSATLAIFFFFFVK